MVRFNGIFLNSIHLILISRVGFDNSIQVELFDPSTSMIRSLPLPYIRVVIILSNLILGAKWALWSLISIGREPCSCMKEKKWYNLSLNQSLNCITKLEGRVVTDQIKGKT